MPVVGHFRSEINSTLKLVISKSEKHLELETFEGFNVKKPDDMPKTLKILNIF